MRYEITVGLDGDDFIKQNLTVMCKKFDDGNNNVTIVYPGVKGVAWKEEPIEVTKTKIPTTYHSAQ